MAAYVQGFGDENRMRNVKKGGSNDSQIADHCHCSYRIRPLDRHWYCTGPRLWWRFWRFPRRVPPRPLRRVWWLLSGLLGTGRAEPIFPATISQAPDTLIPRAPRAEVAAVPSAAPQVCWPGDQSRDPLNRHIGPEPAVVTATPVSEQRPVDLNEAAEEPCDEAAEAKFAKIDDRRFAPDRRHWRGGSDTERVRSTARDRATEPGPSRKLRQSKSRGIWGRLPRSTRP